MLAISPPRIFKIDLSKLVSELSRHLATNDFFDSYGSKRTCLDMLATSPPMIFKIVLSKYVSELASHLATNDFLIYMVQREPV